MLLDSFGVFLDYLNWIGLAVLIILYGIELLLAAIVFSVHRTKKSPTLKEKKHDARTNDRRYLWTKTLRHKEEETIPAETAKAVERWWSAVNPYEDATDKETAVDHYDSRSTSHR